MTITQNKKALFDYTIEERFEAGLALEGWEVKSIRAGQVQLKEAYVIVRGAEIFLLNAHITPLKTASTHVRPEPTRTRKLLLNRREITKLDHQVATEHLALVPLSMYFKDGRVKVELGLGRGRKKADKRQAIAERDSKLEMQKALGRARKGMD